MAESFKEKVTDAGHAVADAAKSAGHKIAEGAKQAKEWVADKTGIVPFIELVDKVMTQEPYASARTVYWVVDNGSSHIGQRSMDRMTAAWPNARLVHLPVHASWLNQIEIVFSIIQRKVVKPADFADLAVLADRLERFEHRYNQTAQPFDWRFTRSDLAAMLQRLDAHRAEPEAALAA